LAIAPGDAETLLNLGNAHLMLQQLQEALAHYQQAASARDDFAGAWFNMGYVLEKMALIERALSAYDRAVAIDSAYTSQVAARRRGIVAK
jgi:tetratricopeptide (TPR) repeat protein